MCIRDATVPGRERARTTRHCAPWRGEKLRPDVCRRRDIVTVRHERSGPRAPLSAWWKIDPARRADEPGATTRVAGEALGERRGARGIAAAAGGGQGARAIVGA